jgi:hypothetical protein
MNLLIGGIMEIIQNNFGVSQCKHCKSWLKVDKSDLIEDRCCLFYVCPCCGKENTGFIFKDLKINIDE